MNYLADTYYFLALLNPNDRDFAKATAFTPKPNELLFTTEWILTELGDGLCDSRNKQTFVTLYSRLLIRPNVRIVQATHELFDHATLLYQTRRDKDWSLTDCTSFVVMQDRGIIHALTADHHFEQAGFVSVLK